MQSACRLRFLPIFWKALNGITCYMVIPKPWSRTQSLENTCFVVQSLLGPMYGIPTPPPLFSMKYLVPKQLTYELWLLEWLCIKKRVLHANPVHQSVGHPLLSFLKCSDEMSHTGNIFHLAPLKLTIKQGVRLSCCWVWGAGELAHSRTPVWAEAPWKCIGSVPSTFLSLGSLEIHPMFLQWGSFPEKKNDHVLLYLESISRSNNSQSQILWHSEDTHSSSVLGSASDSSIPHHNHYPL